MYEYGYLGGWYIKSTLFVLTLASDRADLYGNVAFLSLVLSIKKRYSSFLKKGFRFSEINFKISSDCHTKTYRSFNRSAISKIFSTVFILLLLLSVFRLDLQ